MPPPDESESEEESEEEVVSSEDESSAYRKDVPGRGTPMPYFCPPPDPFECPPDPFEWLTCACRVSYCIFRSRCCAKIFRSIVMA